MTEIVLIIAAVFVALLPTTIVAAMTLRKTTQLVTISEQMHDSTNSKMDELLEQKGLASEAKGRDEERAIGEQRADDLLHEPRSEGG
jgi:hypothetical protein